MERHSGPYVERIQKSLQRMQERRQPSVLSRLRDVPAEHKPVVIAYVTRIVEDDAGVTVEFTSNADHLFPIGPEPKRPCEERGCYGQLDDCDFADR